MAEESYQQQFVQQSALFQPLTLLASLFPAAWPQLAEFNAWLNPTICNANGQAIQFVPQDYRKHKAFAEHYEPRIFLQAEVQTRLGNWHDFFNACCWCLFPKTKASLNQWQYQDALIQQGKNRSKRQQVLTQFDECGVVILCDDQALLQLLVEHRWEALFWQQRQMVIDKMSVMIFGHALYEKALQPYIGLTGKAVLLPRPNNKALNLAQQVAWVDQQLAEYFMADRWQQQDKPLQPLPILGVPGWYDNDYRDFYLDRGYFRSK